jgi:hypothetical protein
METTFLRETSLAASSIIAALASQKTECAMKDAIRIIEMCEDEGVRLRKRTKIDMEESAGTDQEKSDKETETPSMLEIQELEQKEKTSLIEESDKAGCFIIPFGKHKGTLINKAPPDYLCWLMGMRREAGKYLPASTEGLKWVRANQNETLSQVKKYLTWRCWECGSHDVRFRNAHLCTHCWHQARR